ncbi:hypothetical protein EXH46_11785 [Pelomonas puraquae]|uniref:Uncharacterized protein n=1 Tax=Roseateles puraquae TaxID=431059 RepID=A0A254N5H2_9BURK|nr:hypothetical protein [Roseateles puraquae]OWR00855.1 hypothetical protein CDO81_24300 [Roseateles puraquae]
MVQGAQRLRAPCCVLNVPERVINTAGTRTGTTVGAFVGDNWGIAAVALAALFGLSPRRKARSMSSISAGWRAISVSRLASMQKLAPTPSRQRASRSPNPAASAPQPQCSA